MKGIIFNLLETVVTRDLGEDTWDALLEATGLTGAYTSVGTYPHEELLALVGAASAATGRPADELVRWFGRESIPLLYDRYAVFFDTHTTTRGFLLTLNDVIHPEVRKLFPGAYAPSFIVSGEDDAGLLLAYESHRGLCAFGEGLILGTADHYDEQVEVDQTECALKGAPRCVLRTSTVAA
ncbi:MAG TPA: heme NO-binding domain-containing protein [Mycobacteriales bacterium]|nr:heme NO-binding domain-containing protein [Mycobacteriales bacterium]